MIEEKKIINAKLNSWKNRERGNQQIRVSASSLITYGVYFAELGYNIGAEMSLKHPVVILSSRKNNADKNTILVAPLTSFLKNKKSYSSDVFLSKKTSSLANDSIIRLHNIMTIDRCRIVKNAPFYTLTTEEVDNVKSRLKELFNI